MHTSVSMILRTVSLATVVAALASACSSSDSSGSTGAGGSAGSGGSGAAGGGGSTGDGGDISTAGCPGSTCPYVASSRAGASCLALADNTGKDRIDMRMDQLIVTSPPALTTPFIKTTILGNNVRTDFGTACGMSGTGGFSWLFSWDKTKNTMTTGGGPQVATATAAESAGTCFYQFTDATSGQEVKPITVPSTVSADGSWTVEATADLTVPIFLATGGVILLPLNHVQIASDLPFTRSNNCLGEYDTSLDPDLGCLPKDKVSYFSQGAHLDGYITVEQAETVVVADLSETLCVLLSGDMSGQKDAKGVQRCPMPLPKGDWMAAKNPDGTSAAGMSVGAGNGDSWRLQATFSASAVKLNGVATKADCSDAKWN